MFFNIHHVTTNFRQEHIALQPPRDGTQKSIVRFQPVILPMHRIPFLHRIGTKIFGLYLIALLPLVGTILYLNAQTRQDAVAHGRDLLLRAVHKAVGEQERVFTAAVLTLRQLAAAVPPGSRDPAGLDTLVSRLAADNPTCSNIMLFDPEGRIVASAKKPFTAMDVSGQAYFQRALSATGVVAGNYDLGRGTDNPVLHFALALRDGDGHCSGVAVVGVNLRSLPQILQGLDVLPGAFLALIDAQGTLLARAPANPASPVGQPLSGVVPFVSGRSQASGSVVIREPDGTGMIYAYTMLRVQDAQIIPHGALLVGMPAAAAVRQTEGRLVLTTVAVVGSLALAVVLMVLLGRWGIVRRLEVLAGFAASLSEEKICRLPPHFGKDEIGLLGQQFVDLSRRLHDKSEHLSEAMGHLARERDQLSRVVGQLREAKDELERLASRDFLTGLRNKRCFSEKMQLELERYQRYGTPFSLVLFDIDDFKQVNDIYGHQVGDEVLHGLGRLTLSAVRTVDEAYRIGGEEFAVVLPETDGQQALVLAERLRAQLAQLPVPLAAGADIRFTVSLGVAQAGEGMRVVKDLFTAADDALYAAKRTGKNRSVLATTRHAA